MPRICTGFLQESIWWGNETRLTFSCWASVMWKAFIREILPTAMLQIRNDRCGFRLKVMHSCFTRHWINCSVLNVFHLNNMEQNQIENQNDMMTDMQGGKENLLYPVAGKQSLVTTLKNTVAKKGSPNVLAPGTVHTLFWPVLLMTNYTIHVIYCTGFSKFCYII